MPFWLDLPILVNKRSVVRAQSAKDLMKAFAKMNMFLVIGVLWVVFALPLPAVVIFDN